MRMGFLADKISGVSRRVLEICIEGLIFVFAGIVMVYGGWKIVQLTMSQQTASLGVQMGVIYVAVLLSGILICIYAVLNIMELCVSRQGEILEHSFGEKQLEDKKLSDEEIQVSQEILEETEEK